MKHTTSILLASFLCLLFLNTKCNDPYPIETAYKPQFIDRTELENSIKLLPPVGIISPAKIYTKDNILLISERYKGIHFFDNSDKSNPKPLGYLKVLGCLDMAIKGTTLYADNATDLIAVDLSNPNDPKVTSRIKNIFPEPLPPDGFGIPEQFSVENRPPNMIIVDWIKK